MLTFGQIGCGYWGPNLLRNLVANKSCNLKYLVETNSERRDYVKKSFPEVEVINDMQFLLNNPEVNAVVIATPASTHYSITKQALESGKHVLVEKPLAMSTNKAIELAALAQEKKVTLMVGHTFLYNPAVIQLKQILDSGEIGRIYYIYSQRLNLGQVRKDVNSWWNLAPHDVSILLYLMDGELPVTVQARGLDYIQPGIADVAFGTLTWANRVSAHIHVSWLDPEKIRKMTIVGSKKMIIYDDIGPNPLTILDKCVEKVPAVGERMDFDTPNLFQIKLRTGEIKTPSVEKQEPLANEISHFIECATTGKNPITGPKHARDTVAVLEAWQKSYYSHGMISAL